MRARDVMTAHPSVVTPDDTIRKAAQVMRDRSIGMLPVIDNLQDRHLMGVLTDRDIVVRCIAAGHGPECTVREHMTQYHLTSVYLDDEVLLVAAKMRRARIRRLPVLSDGGRLVGVLSLQDLANRLRPADPELVERVERLASAPMQYAH